jgi:hemerythrin superfamily protein
MPGLTEYDDRAENPRFGSEGTYRDWPGSEQRTERAPRVPSYPPRQQPRSEQDNDLGALLIGGALGFLFGVALNPTRKAILQGAEAATGDWYDILKAEHRGVEKAFDALMQTDETDKRKRQMLLTQIAHALNKHAVTEENVIYPALRAHDPEAAKKLGTEHLDIKAELSALQYDLDKDDPRWLEKAKGLRDLIVEHAEDEENRVFPPFRQSMSDEENRSLNRRLHWEGLKIA